MCPFIGYILVLFFFLFGCDFTVWGVVVLGFCLFETELKVEWVGKERGSGRT